MTRAHVIGGPLAIRAVARTPEADAALWLSDRDERHVAALEGLPRWWRRMLRRWRLAGVRIGSREAVWVCVGAWRGAGLCAPASEPQDALPRANRPPDGGASACGPADDDGRGVSSQRSRRGCVGGGGSDGAVRTVTGEGR